MFIGAALGYIVAMDPLGQVQTFSIITITYNYDLHVPGT